MPGLCLLLLDAPFGAVRWLRTPGTNAAGGHFCWLIQALDWAIGILTYGGGSASAGGASKASFLVLVYRAAKK